LPERGGVKKQDTVILFHIDQELKEAVSKAAKLQAKSLTRYLNDLISDHMDSLKQLVKKTGRGNADLKQLEKTKEILRKKPEGVRQIDVANHVGCSLARAARLLDMLSEYSENNPDFLIYQDGERKSTLYFIYKDY
jgi:hypothetical protein